MRVGLGFGRRLQPSDPPTLQGHPKQKAGRAICGRAWRRRGGAALPAGAPAGGGGRLPRGQRARRLLLDACFGPRSCTQARLRLCCRNEGAPAATHLVLLTRAVDAPCGCSAGTTLSWCRRLRAWWGSSWRSTSRRRQRCSKASPRWVQSCGTGAGAAHPRGPREDCPLGTMCRSSAPCTLGASWRATCWASACFVASTLHGL